MEMNSNQTQLVEQKIRSVLEQYLNTYFVERDDARASVFFHADYSGFGTTKDEIASTLEEGRKLFTTLTNSSSPHPYLLKIIRSQVFSERVGMVMATLQIGQTIPELRLTVIFKKELSQWFIYHMHVSKPKLVFPKSYSRLTRQNVWVSPKQPKDSAVYMDQLTGLYNRYKFYELLNKAMKQAQQDNSPLSLIFADIDHFKNANDEHGHLIGDEVLKMIGFLLRYGVRDNDCITRWGGDEFMILLPNTNQQSAIILAERIRHTLSETNNEYQITLSMCFGIAQFDGKESAESLINKADTALYLAKNSGRNRVELQT